MKWFVTARVIGDETTKYIPAKELGLEVDISPWNQEKCVDSKDSFSKQYKVIISNVSDADFCGVIRLETGRICKKPKFYIPGFMYGHNTGEMPSSGRKRFPRMRYDIYSGCPESRDWMVRSDRPAAPVSMIYDEGKLFGISASPYWIIGDDNTLTDKKHPADVKTGLPKKGTFYQYGGFTCSWENEELENCSTVGYTLGYENAPWLFVETSKVLDRAPMTEENCFKIAVGESVQFEVKVYEFDAENVLGIYDVLMDLYEDYHGAPRKVDGMTQYKAIDYLATAMRDAAFIPEDHMYTGFVYDRPGGYEYNKIGSLSWTNGLAVATPMLMAALRLKDEVMRGQALECIEYILTHCMNEASGFPYDAVNDGVWSTRGWWYDGMHTGGHSSYLCGQALYYVLKAYEYEKKLKDTLHPEYLEWVRPILKKVNATVNAEYEYPFAISEKTGVGLEYNSFGGTWLLAATAYYTWLTGDKEYLDLIQKCEPHYYEEYMAKAECYGGPLDTDKAVDSEGNLAYMRALRYLHMVTGEDVYLKHLEVAIQYECSFKLCYNTPIQILPLSKVGWSSCGGTITSTANPHIHPMSSTVTDEIKYYLDQVAGMEWKDEKVISYIQRRLEDTLQWGMQTFNTYDGEYDYGKKGWMSERFCFSQGLLSEHYPDGNVASTWFALMGWASASILEGFAGDCFEEAD